MDTRMINWFRKWIFVVIHAKFHYIHLWKCVNRWILTYEDISHFGKYIHVY